MAFHFEIAMTAEGYGASRRTAPPSFFMEGEAPTSRTTSLDRSTCRPDVLSRLVVRLVGASPSIIRRWVAGGSSEPRPPLSGDGSPAARRSLALHLLGVRLDGVSPMEGEAPTSRKTGMPKNKIPRALVFFSVYFACALPSKGVCFPLFPQLGSLHISLTTQGLP